MLNVNVCTFHMQYACFLILRRDALRQNNTNGTHDKDQKLHSWA